MPVSGRPTTQEIPITLPQPPLFRNLEYVSSRRIQSCDTKLLFDIEIHHDMGEGQEMCQGKIIKLADM